MIFKKRKRSPSPIGLLLTLLLLIVGTIATSTTAEAHVTAPFDTTGRTEGTMYDIDNVWETGYVAWFTHVKKASNATVWRIVDWRVTASPTNYTAPTDVEATVWDKVDKSDMITCGTSGYVDNQYKVANSDLMGICYKAGCAVDTEGYMTCYLQPVARTIYNGDETNCVDSYSLSDWKNAPKAIGQSWISTTGFEDYYNRKIRVSYKPPEGTTNLSVEYKTLSAGDGYKAGDTITSDDIPGTTAWGVNWASEHSYNSIGLTAVLTKGTAGTSGEKTWVLTGIEVVSDDSAYTTGKIYSNTEPDNVLLLGKSYDLGGNTLTSHTDVTTTGYKYDESSSSLYNVTSGKKFRTALGSTKIIYYYSELKTEIKVTAMARFQTGVNSKNEAVYDTPYNSVNTWTKDAGKTFTINQPLAATYSHNDYLYELVEARLDKITSNSQNETAVSYMNQVWGKSKHTFKWSGSWSKNVENNNKLKASSVEDLRYLGTYRIRAPQIQLYYYKDVKGKYHLFRADTGSESLSASGTTFKKNAYGTGGTTTHKVNAFFAEGTYSKAYDNTAINKKLILTQSYAYEGAAQKAVKGYNGSKTNCWSNTALPSKGKGVIDGTEYTTNVQKAWEDYQGGAKSRTTSFSTVQGPAIFVYVYEGGPKLTVLSMYKNTASATKYTVLKAKTTATFKIGTEAYNCATTVEYPLGTTEVDYDTAYKQDGRDQGLTDQITISEKNYWHIKDFISNDSSAIASVRAWASTKEKTVSDVNTVVGNGWRTTKTNKIEFKDGDAVLVKVYDPNPANGVWSVAYANTERTEGGETEAVVSDTNSVYIRLAEPKATVYSMLTQADTSMPFTEGKRLTENGTTDDWTLTNVGYSTIEKPYDVTETKNGVTTSPGANAYASEKITGLEGTNAFNITWKDSNAIKTTRTAYSDLSSFVTGKLDAVAKDTSGGGIKTWLWAVYRANKAVNTVHILRNADGSYEFMDAVSQQELAPLTKTYTVSMEPYFVHNGNVYQLKEMCTTQYKSPDKLTASAVEAWTKQTVEYNDYVPQHESNVMHNLVVYKKTLYVAGVYEECGIEGGEDEETTTEEIIAFRDTLNGAVSAGSWNNLPDGLASDAVYKGVLYNDAKLSSDSYDAATGIPTTEYIASYAYTPKYLVDIDYLRTDYSKNYHIVCYQGVNDVSVTKDDYGNTVTIYTGKLLQEKIKVNRTGHNFVLNGANIWLPTDVTLGNYAIPNDLGQKVTMLSTGLYEENRPSITTGKDAEIKIPTYDPEYLQLNYGVVYTGSSDATGYNSFAAIKDDWNNAVNQRKEDAEGIIAQMTMANQEVTFENGAGSIQRLMVNYGLDLTVDDPLDVEFAKLTSKKVFNSKNDNSGELGQDAFGKAITQEDTTAMCIDTTKSNGLKESTGAVHYKCYPTETGAVVYEKNYFKGDVEQVLSTGVCFAMATNDVTIHTPVVVSFTISDEDADSQIVYPGIGQDMVLDKQFTLTISSTGAHNGNAGYGYKDYSRYYERKDGQPIAQVKFPFPVIAPSSLVEGATKDLYYKANVWISVPVGDTTFFLPSWADEGDSQLIRVRANAINARENNETLTQAEVGANLSNENYLCYTQELVEVIGRVYGLSIIDIGDYPLWENYFRTNGALNGNAYYSGLANRNGFLLGIAAQYTFPTVAGSNPAYSNQGVLKPGYVVKYKLETVGNLFSADDYVRIEPEFYYVSKDDGNRTKVDVYYDEEINGTKRQYVRIGSDDDKLNAKYLNLIEGDYGISGTTLAETASYLGYDTTNAFAMHSSPIYTFGNIMLNQYTRVFEGKNHESILDNGTSINWWEAGMSKLAESDTILDQAIATSVQDWYGQYYLPSKIYATNLDEETVRSKLISGENPWLSDGYLVVNFNVTAVNEGEVHLAYDAPRINEMLTQLRDEEGEGETRYAGRCNMWDVEAFVNTKTDANGQSFEFKDGDFMMIDLDDSGSATNDHGSGGTQ